MLLQEETITNFICGITANQFQTVFFSLTGLISLRLVETKRRRTQMKTGKNGNADEDGNGNAQMKTDRNQDGHKQKGIQTKTDTNEDGHKRKRTNGQNSDHSSSPLYNVYL